MLWGRAVCPFRSPRLVSALGLFRLHRFPFQLPDLLQIGIPDLDAQSGGSAGGLLPDAFRSLLGIAGDVTAPTYAELYAKKSRSTTSSGLGS